ncbi:MAG: RICIN domain-containing protein [Chitinophagaceae bacterium]|nr:RICIN domain-containing protein [Chitinophagaceae bacterium]
MRHLLITLTTAIFSFGLVITTNAQLKDGEIVKIKNVNAAKYVVPKDVNTAPNSQMVINTGRNDAWFTWKVISEPGGYYRFQNMHTNMFLGTIGSSKEQYGFICQKYAARNNADVLWKLVNTATGFKLKNKNSNLFAAVEGGSKNNNAILVQWSDNAQPDIIWQFETAGSGNSTAGGKKILFDVVLNYLAVSEATRNKIDNGDCKRIFGQVSTELWELDENNEMKTKLRSYNNMPEMIYNQTNYQSPPTAALSYYQDNKTASENNTMGKVTYNIPENLLKEKKLMLVVKTFLGTRHKDNDFASFDALKMGEAIQHTYILNSSGKISETIETITDLATTNKSMNLINFVVPFSSFVHADDTHKLWVKFSTKIN